MCNCNLIKVKIKLLFIIFLYIIFKYKIYKFYLFKKIITIFLNANKSRLKQEK